MYFKIVKCLTSQYISPSEMHDLHWIHYFPLAKHFQISYATFTTFWSFLFGYYYFKLRLLRSGRNSKENFKILPATQQPSAACSRWPKFATKEVLVCNSKFATEKWQRNTFQVQSILCRSFAFVLLSREIFLTQLQSPSRRILATWSGVNLMQN